MIVNRYAKKLLPLLRPWDQLELELDAYEIILVTLKHDRNSQQT